MNGLTATGVFGFSILLGLFFIYRSRKLQANLLLYLGTTYFFAGLVYTGDVLDFVTILLTGKNFDNSLGIIGLINWMWFPGAILSAIYIGSELLIPRRKWYLVSVYIILAIIFELFLFLDTSGSITYTNPIPGEDLINDNLIEDSPIYYLGLVFLLSIIIVLGFGFLVRAIRSRGVIRRNFLFLSIGAFVYTIGGILDGLFSPGIILIFTRSAMIISAWLFYLGLRPS